MAYFFGILPGETIVDEAIRIVVPVDGERVYMHGKWLDIGPDHAVIVYRGSPKFIRADGRALLCGEFPAWAVRGKGKSPVCALMFSITQFVGGKIEFETNGGRRCVGLRRLEKDARSTQQDR